MLPYDAEHRMLDELCRGDVDAIGVKAPVTLNVVAIVKGNERYVFMFDDAHKADAQRTAGRWASNEELAFNWYDAATVSQKVRQA